MSVVTKDTIQPSSGQALTIKDEGGTASITVATNGEATFAENIIIGTAGKGIDFSATANGAGTSSVGEVFDDYETGQFTVSFSNAQSGFTTGYYRKVGDVVFVTAYLRCTGSGASGTTFSGLPFNCATAEGKQGGGVVQYHNFDTSTNFKVDAIYNTDDFRFVYNGNSVGQIQAGTECYVAFFYFVD